MSSSLFMADLYYLLFDQYHLMADLYHVLAHLYHLIADLYNLMADLYHLMANLYQISHFKCFFTVFIFHVLFFSRGYLWSFSLGFLLPKAKIQVQSFVILDIHVKRICLMRKETFEIRDFAHDLTTNVFHINIPPSRKPDSHSK